MYAFKILINTDYTFSQLLRSLSSNTGGGIMAELTLGVSPFIYNFSFCLEVFYLYFMSISAAQINYYAHKISNVLRECPMEYHSSEVCTVYSKCLSVHDSAHHKI